MPASHPAGVSDEKVTISDLRRRVSEFVSARDWEKYHNPKDLAISLVIEASELLELFQWRDVEEIDLSNDELRARIMEELADVLIYCLSLTNAISADLSTAVLGKIEKNERKYPVEEYLGKAHKD